jgi:hypothetical protein
MYSINCKKARALKGPFWMPQAALLTESLGLARPFTLGSNTV